MLMLKTVSCDGRNGWNFNSKQWENTWELGGGQVELHLAENWTYSGFPSQGSQFLDRNWLDLVWWWPILLYLTSDKAPMFRSNKSNDERSYSHSIRCMMSHVWFNQRVWMFSLPETEDDITVGKCQLPLKYVMGWVSVKYWTLEME